MRSGPRPDPDCSTFTAVRGHVLIKACGPSFGSRDVEIFRGTDCDLSIYGILILLTQKVTISFRETQIFKF
jgi:hypothetical protein